MLGTTPSFPFWFPETCSCMQANLLREGCGRCTGAKGLSTLAITAPVVKIEILFLVYLC